MAVPSAGCERSVLGEFIGPWLADLRNSAQENVRRRVARRVCRSGVDVEVDRAVRCDAGRAIRPRVGEVVVPARWSRAALVIVARELALPRRAGPSARSRRSAGIGPSSVGLVPGLGGRSGLGSSSSRSARITSSSSRSSAVSQWQAVAARRRGRPIMLESPSTR